MSFFNSSGIDFKEVMSAVVDSSTAVQTITHDCIVKLDQVTMVDHGGDKPPTIKLRWVNDAKESILDFRNFNGGNGELLAKQIVNHTRLLQKLGHRYSPEELNGFGTLNDLIHDMYRSFLLVANRSVGIYVEQDDKYWNIKKYVSPSEVAASEQEAYEDDMPF